MRLRPGTRQSLIEKLENLERYFDRTISIDAMVEEEKDHFIVRLVAHLVRKKIIKAEAQSLDLNLAINEAIENLKSQMTRFKDQLKDYRGEAAAPKPEAEGAPAAAGNSNPLMRTEIYLRKPMTVEEALIQLDSYNRDLFLFDDADGGGLRILHRHPDGQIELLEPKY